MVGDSNKSTLINKDFLRLTRVGEVCYNISTVKQHLNNNFQATLSGKRRRYEEDFFQFFDDACSGGWG